MKVNLKQDGKRFIMMAVAGVLMAVNLKMLIKAGGLYPGGVSGITILLQTVLQKYFSLNVPYTPINLVLNIVPFYIGFKYVGKRLTTFSGIMVLLMSVLTDILPQYMLTDDILLICVFGGIINGIAMCICLLAGATGGGSDLISLHLSNKGYDSWNIIFCANVVILLIAGLLFGIDKALYSIIYQFVSTQVINTLYKRYQKSTLFIVTVKPDEIAAEISNVTHHGATILDGMGAYDHNARNVVYSVVGRDECDRVIKAVRAIDEGAFVNELKTEVIKGRFYQKPME